MRRRLVLFVPLVFLLWVIVSGILNGLGFEHQYLLGAVPTAALGALMYWARTKLVLSGMPNMKLRVDPSGMAQSDQAHERFVAWENMRAAGSVVPFVGVFTGQLAGTVKARARPWLTC